MNSIAIPDGLALQADLPAPLMTARACTAIDLACNQLERCLSQLGESFPGDTTRANFFTPAICEPSSSGAPAPSDGNGSWTSGFWTGLLWMGFELSGRKVFQAAALQQVNSFEARVEQHYVLDHHDLGFLFMPSCVAALRQPAGAGSPARANALQAAHLLMTRYLPNAGVIQAWGQLDNPAQRGRIIIDCLLNLPLLHWAQAQHEAEGRPDPGYRAAAISHALRSREHLVRPDASSFHTFHFDPASGAPLRGSTAQGAGDDSCWARGQAWGLYGFALNHRWAPEHGFLATAELLAERFLADLADNGIAIWDQSFAADSGEPWDSSASAIAACGLYEIAALCSGTARERRYVAEADRILDGLLRHCTAWSVSSNALLLHGVYSKPEGIGVDEASLWGDYFFLEALARRAYGWTPHWYPAKP